MVLSQGLIMLGSFILMPLIVGHVGKELYGAYVLTIAFNGYFGLFDFGIGTAVTKYTAEYRGQGDISKVNEIVSAAFVFYIFFALLVSSIIFFIALNIDQFFSVKNNKELIEELFKITALFSLIIWPTKLFRDTLEGFQRFDLIAKINILTQLAYISLTYIFLKNGYGVITILVLTHSLAVLNNLLLCILTFKNSKQFKITFPYLYFGTFKKIFSFSFFIFLCSMAGFISRELSNVIIGSFLSFAAIALFQPAYMFQKSLAVFITKVIGGSFRVASAEAEGKGNDEKQRYLLLEGGKFITMAAIPLIVIVIFFMEPLINYWLGEGFNESIFPAQVIVASWAFNAFLEVGLGIVIAKSKVKAFSKILIAEAFLYLALSLILINFIGIAGVAISVLVARMTIFFPALLALTLKSVQMPILNYFKLTFQWNCILFFITFFVSFLVREYFYPKNLFIMCLEIGFIYFFVIAFCYIFQMSQEDRNKIKTLIRI